MATTQMGKAAGIATARGIERCAGPLSISSAINNTNTQKSSFSSATTSDDDDHHFGVWQPNQTTVIFQRMEETCPDVLTAYAQCVTEKQNGGALIEGACEENFQAVMNCFKSVRR